MIALFLCLSHLFIKLALLYTNEKRCVNSPYLIQNDGKVIEKAIEKVIENLIDIVIDANGQNVQMTCVCAIEKVIENSIEKVIDNRIDI